ncbi:MAG: response regulator [Lachnospiraceae bacterium]|nr:response regulator [Lachnospiraceae bacterium]
MSTHDILLTIQYITVGALFAEICIVFLGWKNSIHSYLFLACVSTFISNLGYLLEMKATTEEAYLTALKLSYAGRVWISFLLFLFAARMCRIRIPKWVTALFGLINTAIYLTILTIGSNGAYYRSYEFVPYPVSPVFYHTNGSMHDLLMGMNCVFAVLALRWLIREYLREKNRKSKSRYLCLIMSFGVQILSLIVQLSGVFEISRYYDLTMPGALFGTILLLIGILGFDLLGTSEIARDFVIDRISEGIIAVDNEGRIQYYNEPVTRLYPEFLTFFGKTEPAKTGSHKKTPDLSEPQASMGHARTPYDIISEIDGAVRNNDTIHIGDRIYTPEENELELQGESYGRLFVLVDDTEHYHYIEEVQKQRDIADRANEAKSRFLANMSHEIRTPINAVIGMDEMILRESNEKSIRAYAADIMSAGRTLLSLINDILDLSKVEEGKMDIIPVQYDLSSLINDLVNLIRERAEKKALILNVSVDQQIPHLLVGDEIRIRQCVMNLLTNAVKYTEKGAISLTVSADKTDDSHISLCFSVLDTGIGMKPEDMEYLFSPYKRIEEKRNRAIEGTGLGMSITRQLLELMGSRLEVESEYGKGSKFSFAVEQEVAKWDEIGEITARFRDISSAMREYRELFHAPKARILVVDDTEMNLTVIKSLLKRTLISIDTAASGKDAVRMSASSAYDILFIDHMMPDMDGIETLKAIRASGMCKDAPSVALTANAVSGAREKYLEAGFTDYLSKPVDGEKLERMIKNMLPAEKVEPAEETTEAEDCSTKTAIQETENSDFLKKLECIEEIDVQAGLKNCGSEEGYLSVISVFHQTAKNKADEIEMLCRQGDIENFTIKVHALKSSARIIGATELSGLALKLEDAGKSGDKAFIDDNTDRLLKMYRSLNDGLSRLDSTDEDRPEISGSMLKEAYQTIAEIAGSYDYELMDGILKDLRGYRLPASDRERISDIEKMLTELDWEGIAEKAGEVI